ncbi:MAG: alpha/beta hydrolase [Paracoccus sp. (in: a-proteobacteria)]|nr:alpha/beta hydrolase [Paracoccus sp. (in: a-proteobacteria)]
MQLPGDDAPPARAFWLRTEDDLRLRIVLWRADDAHRGTVLLFPGRSEYCEKYAPRARWLNAQGLNVLCIDWRGQGLSDRLLADPRPGHIGSFADYGRDVVEMTLASAEMELPQPWHLLAHSMGGTIGLAALLEELPVKTASFSAPMLGIIKGRLPRGAINAVSGLAGRVGGSGTPALGTGGRGTYVLDEGFSHNLLTGDPAEWARFIVEAASWPELTLGGASWGWVHAAIAECTRLAALPAPDLPALIGIGSAEAVVSPAAIRERAAGWPSARLLELEGARHELLMETEERRDAFLSAMIALIDGDEGRERAGA